MSPCSYFGTRFGQHRLVLALSDCVWSCVVGSEENEERFLDLEGIFLLLDMLESAPKDLRAPILGVLVDLSERDK